LYDEYWIKMAEDGSNGGLSRIGNEVSGSITAGNLSMNE
jgi:hypothetical protein